MVSAGVQRPPIAAFSLTRLATMMSKSPIVSLHPSRFLGRQWCLRLTYQAVLVSTQVSVANGQRHSTNHRLWKVYLLIRRLACSWCQRRRWPGRTETWPAIAHRPQMRTEPMDETEQSEASLGLGRKMKSNLCESVRLSISLEGLLAHASKQCFW